MTVIKLSEGKLDEVKRLPLDESKALHLEYPESEQDSRQLMDEGRMHNLIELFVRNYLLLLKYREGICNTPELANINLRSSFFKGYIGCGSIVSLGKLLSLDAAGILRSMKCEHCGSGKTLVYYCGGSPFTGAGFSYSICLDCCKISRKDSNSDDVVHAACRYNKIAPFPYTKTRWTMSALIHALKALELEEGK